MVVSSPPPLGNAFVVMGVPRTLFALRRALNKTRQVVASQAHADRARHLDDLVVMVNAVFPRGDSVSSH